MVGGAKNSPPPSPVPSSSPLQATSGAPFAPHPNQISNSPTPASHQPPPPPRHPWLPPPTPTPPPTPATTPTAPSPPSPSPCPSARRPPRPTPPSPPSPPPSTFPTKSPHSPSASIPPPRPPLLSPSWSPQRRCILAPLPVPRLHAQPLPLLPSGAPAAAGRRRTLVWFRADLRLHDHEPLHAAAGASSSLLPVFVFDPRDFGKSPSGFDRTGPYRANFLLDSVADLRRSLRALGGDLVVRVGRPEVVIPELARAAGVEAVYAHGEVSRDECRAEERVSKAMEKEGIEVKYFWGSTLYHLDDLPFPLEDMPSNYGGFREAVKELEVRKVLDAPEEVKCVPMKNVLEPGEMPTLAEFGLTAPPAMAQDPKPAVGSTLIGGEAEALERLKKFAAECCMQPNKAEKDSTRDSIYGANFSCKISPWLATGCLSPRFMYEELKKHAARAIPSESTPKNGDGTSDAGTNWLMFELLWRDFFRFITKKYSSAQKTSEVAPATGCTPVTAFT